MAPFGALCEQHTPRRATRCICGLGGWRAGLLFFTTYTLLVLFWAEIYHQARSLPTGFLRPIFLALNVLVYGVQVRGGRGAGRGGAGVRRPACLPCASALHAPPSWAARPHAARPGGEHWSLTSKVQMVVYVVGDVCIASAPLSDKLVPLTAGL